MTRNYKITATFLSPIALKSGSIWTLDGICWGILNDFREKRHSLVGENLHSLIPIDRHESGMFYATGYNAAISAKKSYVKIGGFRPVKDFSDADKKIKTKGNRPIPKVSTTRLPYKAHLSNYSEISTPKFIGIVEPVSRKKSLIF